MSAATLQRPEQTVAWECRGHWAAHRHVVLTLSDRCMIDRLEGRIEYVSVTGAFVVIDGWRVPTVEILGVARPHHSQRQRDREITG